ncbi:hypothetical protein BGZ76_011509 [Entomortierella beljakovae]|nr:hypothetical protein BGZ76_011509 [Entomortierella beljakovae]
MDHGAIFSSSSLETSTPKDDSQRTRNTSGSITSQTSLTHVSKGDSSGKRSHGSVHRSSSNDMSRKAELYKTELCISINTGAPCKYGENCQFAHSTQELQHVTRHPRYKTQFCTNFQTHGFCKYNDRCTFIHHSNEARAPTTAAQSPEKTEERSTRSKSNSSSTDSRPRIPLSASDLETKHIERLRALSDPGIKFTGQGGLVTATPVVELQSVSTVIPRLVPDTPQIVVPILPADQVERSDHQQLPLGPLPILQNAVPQSRIADTNAPMAGFANMRRHIAERLIDVSYSTDPNMPEMNDFNHELRSVVLPTTNPVRTNLVHRRNHNHLWRGSIQVGDEEEEWASKLAYYISTPQNDFDI